MKKLIIVIALMLVACGDTVYKKGDDCCQPQEDPDGVYTVYGSVYIENSVHLAQYEPYERVTSHWSAENLHGLEELSVPNLESVEGELAIMGCPSIETISFPALVSVQGDIYIIDNPKLPQCMVDELVQKLIDNGWTGELTTSGNDESATCE